MPPVPNTAIAEDPTADAIWHRWFEMLLARITQAGQILHNTLGGLQGGAAGEFFHLTEDEHDAISNIPADSLLGRGDASGTGPAERITLGSGVILTGTVLSASGGAGTVTSVDAAGSDILTFTGGPVTTAGTLTAQTGSILAFAAAHG